MVFHYINENVRPLRIALAQANAELKSAMDKLNNLRARLAVSQIKISLFMISETKHKNNIMIVINLRLQLR